MENKKAYEKIEKKIKQKMEIKEKLKKGEKPVRKKPSRISNILHLYFDIFSFL